MVDDDDARLLLSVQRLALSCEVPRERSDRGLRQLQRPSSAASVSIPEQFDIGSSASSPRRTLLLGRMQFEPLHVQKVLVTSCSTLVLD
jgi:hypothetical protein